MCDVLIFKTKFARFLYLRHFDVRGKIRDIKI